MLQHLKKIQKNLIVVIPVVMVGGFLTGLAVNPAPLKQLILPLTFLMVYPMMINLQLKKVVEGGDIKVQSAAWYVKFTDRIFGPAPDATVKDIMLTGVFSLHSANTIQDALRLLAEEHIHSFAVLDENEKPIGMVTTALLLDSLADGTAQETQLSELSLEPALLISAQASLKEALAQMKRTHEYKVLIPNADGTVSHVLTQEEIIQHFAEKR